MTLLIRVFVFLPIIAVLSAASARAQPYYASGVRIEVEPKDAEVFLDGYLVGIVDDFDGFFQALRVRPGEHDLEFVKEGYHNLRRRIFVEPGGNFRVRHTTMEKLRSGDAPVIVRTPSTSSSVLVRPRRSM